MELPTMSALPFSFRAARGRRGQTLILALAVLFLLVLLGSIFVTIVARNLSRSSHFRRMSRSESLAWAGIRFAAEQFRTSQSGADWRPVPTEDLWRTPTPANPGFAAARGRDPDYPWLSDDGLYFRPYTRYRSQGGRFLLRVTYAPKFRADRYDPNNPQRYNFPHYFDTNSAYIHVESIGRPGDVDPTDPTTLTGKQGEILGEFRKAEAWVPVGLVDQLLWITNRNEERTAATLGVGNVRDVNGVPVPYEDDPDDTRDNTGTEFFGGIRSDTDLRWLGNATVHLFPARGDQVSVSGEITHLSPGGQPQQVLVILHDDTNDPDFIDNQDDFYPDAGPLPFRGRQFVEAPSTDPAFQPLLDPATGSGSYLDKGHLGNVNVAGARSIGGRQSPNLEVEPEDAASTRVSRYLALTRDSGITAPVTYADTATGQSETRVVNLGAYGFGEGIYVDNARDIQFPDERPAVIHNWLQNGQSERFRIGWVGPVYVPSAFGTGPASSIQDHPLSVIAGEPTHPILEIRFALDGIHMTRYDPDIRNANFGSAVGRTRIFYNFQKPQNGGWVATAVGPSVVYPYPRNGVIYCEGSCRVSGTVGEMVNGQFKPRQVSVVSGGTIYIEGNLLRGRDPQDVTNQGAKAPSASFIGLLAQDYVTLNPTAFARVNPGPDVSVEADLVVPGQDPSSWHWSVPPNGDLDVESTNADAVDDSNNQTPAYLLHVQHSAQSGDAAVGGGQIPGLSTLQSAIQLLAGPAGGASAAVPFTDPTGTVPSYAPQNLFNFQVFPQGAVTGYNYSPYLSSPGGTVNYERKSFILPTMGQQQAISGLPGATNVLKFWVRPESRQNYWFSHAALIPADKPLKIEIHAVMYAQNGSWFVIPPPYFNDDQLDTRAAYVQRGAFRGPGTYPVNAGYFPYYHEPLNVDVEIHGALTENMPADPSDQAAWTSRMWMRVPEVGTQARTDFDQQNGTANQPLTRFHPRMRFFYEPDLRRYCRYRILATGEEGIAYTGPVGQPPQIIYQKPAQVETIDAVLTRAQGVNSYAVTLPVLPRLPSGPVIYEGSVVQ